MVTTRATAARTDLVCIDAGAVTAEAAVTALIDLITAAGISRARRRNRHKTKAVATSRGSQSSATTRARASIN
jgi:hypothetical protein